MLYLKAFRCLLPPSKRGFCFFNSFLSNGIFLYYRYKTIGKNISKRKSLKIMSVSEITTFDIQRQLLDRRVASEEVSVPLETDSSLQTNGVMW